MTPAPVVLVYDSGALHADAASQDVLQQLDAVESALHTLGRSSGRLGASLDLHAFKQRLLTSPPPVVFNLVESLDGSDRLQTAITMFLESWGLAFTGCGSMAMMVSNHKLETKRRLVDANIPTAPCLWSDPNGVIHSLPGPGASVSGVSDWILKAVESHASLFMDDSSVMRRATPGQVSERLLVLSRHHGQAFFAEQFIDGREFNLSVLESADGTPVVFPPAEICFNNLPAGKPRIVGYAAKWDEDSTEYQGTPRRFIPGNEECPLMEKLVSFAKSTWSVLGLSGYARVDFRVDGFGCPYVLEANSNPCLSLDAGFAAAAECGGLGYVELIGRILGVAEKRCRADPKGS